MGLGLLGRGINDAKFFCEAGARVTVTDLKNPDQLSSSLKELEKFPITFVLGEHREADFTNQDLIIKGPGVPRDSIFLKIAKENNIPIEMDESLFAKYCPCPIIGVTGTRGKTTTTTLIYEILKSAGKKVFLGGNIKGLATLPLISKVDNDSFVVMELSSWQLQGFADAKISPNYSVFTNIYPDHLDKYRDMAEYIEDKKAIFYNQTKDDHLFLNSDDKMVSKFSSVAKAKINWFSAVDITADIKLKILGRHNLSNAAAALKVASALGIDYQTIKKTLEDFPGVSGRLELAREINGIKFINDTTSTTPIATKFALEAFPNEKIILICGGADKKLEFTELAEKIKTVQPKIFLLKGLGTDKLLKALKDANYDQQLILGSYDDLSQTVRKAFIEAKSGEIILFSPACASFGLFKNEFHRGEEFIKAIAGLE
jgi:UDP-N-acetylmuramoylalanine--D-glutamate ligase